MFSTGFPHFGLHKYTGTEWWQLFLSYSTIFSCTGESSKDQPCSCSTAVSQAHFAFEKHTQSHSLALLLTVVWLTTTVNYLNSITLTLQGKWKRREYSLCFFIGWRYKRTKMKWEQIHKIFYVCVCNDTLTFLGICLVF